MALPLVVQASLLAVTAAAALWDQTTGRIPNWLTYPSALLGLGLWTALSGLPGLGASALGLAAAFVPLLILHRTGAGLGGGDVKLMGGVGALAAWPLVIHALFYSFIVAAVLGLVMMIWRRQTVATFRRMGRTLKSVLLPGVQVVSPSARESILVPFAVCVCLGSAWMLVEVTTSRTLWELLRGVV